MIQINTSTPFAGFIESRIGGRPENQDTCGYADTPLGLLVVVCDGMGGRAGGKLASALAVDTIIQTIGGCSSSTPRKEAIRGAIRNAHLALLQKVQEQPALKGMGTTVAAVLINEYSCMVAHAGDSRIYQLRKGNKKYRTFDHSLVFDLVKNGTLTEEQARLSSQSNVITRALGIGVDVEVDIEELPFEKGDRFMVCTDGIWGVMPEKELMKIVAGTPSTAGTVERLVIHTDEMGFANGGAHDNLTVVLLETTCNSILKEKMSTRTRNTILGLAIVCTLSIIGNIVQLISGPEQKQVQEGNRSNTLEIDSLITVRIMEERTRSDQKHQKEIDALTQLINDKQVDKAKELLEENKKKQELVKKLDTIIEKLEELKSKKEGKDKNREVQNVLTELNKLTPGFKEYGITEADLKYKNKDQVTDLLTHSIAKDPPSDKSRGHYKAIIGVLSSVRDKINN